VKIRIVRVISKLLPTPNFSDCANKRLGVFLGARPAGNGSKNIKFCPCTIRIEIWCQRVMLQYKIQNIKVI
jgi:hypothetical protein